MAGYFVGIDLGSRTAKIVLISDSKLLYSNHMSTGINPRNTARELFDLALKENNLNQEDIAKTYSTGYGRNIVDFSDKRISEISCHAKGVHFFIPNVKTVIDIGGQDSKVINLSGNGKVTQFVMNDKCAAGTGRFLEVVANILEVTVDDLAELSNESVEDLNMNSTCVVFAESEIIGLIAAGHKSSDIINSVHRSIAKRTRNLIAQLPWQEPVVFTGGVAQNGGMVRALEDVLNVKLKTPDDSFITGALGAALFAEEA